MKKTFYTEAAYLIGMFMLALGTAFTAHTDFGVSMVVAPAYILHLKFYESFPFLTFGIAEYFLQAIMIIILVIFMKKFKMAYLFSIVTALIYAVMLDVSMVLINLLPEGNVLIQIIYYTIGLVVCLAGLSFLFKTYIPLKSYDLFVVEISKKYKINISVVKTIYDISFLFISIAMSFAFFGMWQFKGVSIGTIITAIIGGYLVNIFIKLTDKLFVFKDAFKFRSFFEGKNK